VLRAVVRDLQRIEERIDVASAPRQQLQNLILKLYSGGKTVTFGDSQISVTLSSGKKIGIDLLSSGEKQVLMLLVETLNADESSLLIDEPEISMHVDWQRQLVGAMRLLNPQAQFLFSTHSPEIMAEVAEPNIIRMP
jgi:predicted ATP-binding protein involved in virulence